MRQTDLEVLGYCENNNRELTIKLVDKQYQLWYNNEIVEVVSGEMPMHMAFKIKEILNENK